MTVAGCSPPLIVVVEGVDRVGKDLQARDLAGWLGGTHYTSPDYGSPSGVLVREHLADRIAMCNMPAGRRAGMVDVMTFECVAIADRYAVAAKAVENARAGRWSVVSRWWQSSVVYGVDAGVSPHWVQAATSLLPTVGLAILLDVEDHGDVSRRLDAGNRNERDVEKQRRLMGAYRALWRRETAKAPNEWSVVDASGSPREVRRRVREAVAERWPALRIRGDLDT